MQSMMSVQPPPPHGTLLFAQGTTAYHSAQTVGVPQNPVTVPLAVIRTEPPKYEYVPDDFMTLSLLTIVVCGIFSPLSLLFSVPALLQSLQSRKNAQIGAIEIARKRGMMAAYLNVTAITAALLVACFVTGMALGLYREEYARQKYLLDHAYNW